MTQTTPTSPWRAVIDIGTNSVLLLIARRRLTARPSGHLAARPSGHLAARPSGHLAARPSGPESAGPGLEVALDESTITRLGKGVAQSGVLAPESIARTLEVLRRYRETAERFGAAPLAVTTEGVRLARNRDDFLTPAAEVLGSPVRLLSGEEEAELSFRSVAQETAEGGPLRVLDIGGGSTEIAVGDGEKLVSSVSHPIGAVRLTERFVTSDPPTREAIAAIEAEALATFERGQPLPPHPVLHGLAGTVTTAAALLLGLQKYDRERVDGSVFSAAQVRALRDELARETSAERCRRPALDPGRADVVVTGLSILLAALRHCGADTLVVRDRGLRYALLAEAAR